MPRVSNAARGHRHKAQTGVGNKVSSLRNGSGHNDGFPDVRAGIGAGAIPRPRRKSKPRAWGGGQRQSLTVVVVPVGGSDGSAGVRRYGREFILRLEVCLKSGIACDIDRPGVSG